MISHERFESAMRPHERNAGKTAALRTVSQLTTGEIVIVQDADLEYDPSDMMASFARFSKSRGRSCSVPDFLVRRASARSHFLSLSRPQGFDVSLQCTTTSHDGHRDRGYKAFARDIIRNRSSSRVDLGFEVEVDGKDAKLKVRLRSANQLLRRTYDEGKKVVFMRRPDRPSAGAALQFVFAACAPPSFKCLSCNGSPTGCLR